jgi:transcriptional regulator with XRE-family HTH domain
MVMENEELSLRTPLALQRAEGLSEAAKSVLKQVFTMIQESGLTQGAALHGSGVSQQSLNQWVHGSSPNLKSLESLARHLGFSLSVRFIPPAGKRSALALDGNATTVALPVHPPTMQTSASTATGTSTMTDDLERALGLIHKMEMERSQGQLEAIQVAAKMAAARIPSGPAMLGSMSRR